MASRLCPFCMQMTNTEACPHCGKNTNYAGQPLHLPAGYVVSGRHPYVLGAALGQGGFGITYIALDMVTNTRVAIKEYFPTHCSGRTGNNAVTAYQNQSEIYQKGKERFLDEAKTLKSLSDLKSIVNVLDYFEANNSAYLVMEFLDGISLKDYAARKGKFPARKFLNHIRPLMEDIQRMHERGVIHRDIAPDNIMLMPDGQMKLIDFGAARSYVSGKSMTMVVKKGFAPVEQYLSHGSTASTDVYALAATIYYCITGRVPPDSADREYAGTALASPKSLGAELTSQQEKAILKALKVQQKERTQSVKAFLADLQKKQPLILLPRSRKLLLLILAVLASILIFIGIIFLLPDKEPVREDSVPGNHASETASPSSAQSETEKPDTPSTTPAETEASDKSSSDKPSSGSSNGGSGNSGASSNNKPSSGGSSSGGSSPSTSPTDSPSYDDNIIGGGGGIGGVDNDHNVPDVPENRPDNDSGNDGSAGEESPGPSSTTPPSSSGSSSGSGSSGSGSSGSGSSGSGSSGDGPGSGSSGGMDPGSGSSGGSSSGGGASAPLMPTTPMFPNYPDVPQPF